MESPGIMRNITARMHVHAHANSICNSGKMKEIVLRHHLPVIENILINCAELVTTEHHASPQHLNVIQTL